MTPEAEAEAIQALDRANSLRLVSGTGLALLGTFLLFYLLVRSKRKPIPLLSLLLAILLILGGLYLASWQVYY
jgi:hypothetical protein